MRRVVGLLVLVAVVGCDKEKAGGSVISPECKQKASELRAYLTAVFDPAQKPAPPWPTGDAMLDKEFDAARAKVRALMKPVDPAAPMPKLTPGLPERPEAGHFAECPAAAAQFREVAEVAPAERTKSMIAIADAVESCNCKVSIPRIKAALYLGQRGPD
jgi:hypothetical protein